MSIYSLVNEEDIDRPGRGQPCGIVKLGRIVFVFISFVLFCFPLLLALQHVAINCGKHSPWLGKLFRFQFNGLSFHLQHGKARIGSVDKGEGFH